MNHNEDQEPLNFYSKLTTAQKQKEDILEQQLCTYDVRLK